MDHGSDEDMITPPHKPIFVPKYNPDHGGNDFLGLRAVNTNLMGQCLPGINNVVIHVRPFALISWIFWKFYQLAAVANQKMVTSDQLRVWQEKIEILFTWSHVLHGVGGIPGTQAVVPKTGFAPLDFASWKRQPSSTSLMAALQYGPAAKSPDGLGFIEQTESGLFRTTGFGNHLAEALNKALEGVGRSKLLRDLTDASATPAEAAELYRHWAIQTPTSKERRAFWSAFFSEASLGNGTRAGERSVTLLLVMQTLRTASGFRTEDEIRSALFHGMVTQRKPFSVPRPFITQWHHWICLQVRQAQRLALESLLGWLERRLTNEHEHDVEIIGAYITSLWKANDSSLPYRSKVSQISLEFTHENLHSLLQRSTKDESYSILALMNKLLECYRNEDDLQVLYALRILFLCAEYARVLSLCETVDAELSLGGAERISLKFWQESLSRFSNLRPKEFISLLLEQFVISQHLAVAAMRYDGGSQRLRLSIEEEGLTVLSDGYLPLTVTRDRLFTALSLMAECRMIEVDTENWTFAVSALPVRQA